jgi:hypothetical protein
VIHILEELIGWIKADCRQQSINPTNPGQDALSKACVLDFNGSQLAGAGENAAVQRPGKLAEDSCPGSLAAFELLRTKLILS